MGEASLVSNMPGKKHETLTEVRLKPAPKVTDFFGSRGRYSWSRSRSMMRRSSSTGRSSTGRPSVEPLRVRNDGNVGGTKIAVPANRSRSAHAGGRLSSDNKRSMGALSRGSIGTGFGTQNVRRSSGYGRGYGRMDGMVKDPRPLSDKTYQHKCIRSLLDFLMERAYPHHISTKILQSPPVKEFLRIYEFIYGHIIPKYKTPAKYEEEIPKAFKELGYPYNISKSSLYAIGSPHAWPSLLAALVWLCDHIRVFQEIASQDFAKMMFLPKEDEFDDVITHDRLCFDYKTQTFEAFLAGADSYEEQDEDLMNAFKARAMGQEGDIESLSGENHRLEKELLMLEEDKDQMRKLEEECEAISLDILEFKKYLQQLDDHRVNREKQMTEHSETKDAVLTEQEAVLENNKRMQSIYDSQEFTPADIERIAYEQQELQRQTDSVQKEVAQLESEIWASELGIAKTRERVEDVCTDYNHMAQMLKLIPSSAENANGHDLEMHPKFGGRYQAANTFLSTVKPALHQLKTELEEKLIGKKRDKFKISEALEQWNEFVSQKQNSVTVLESQLKRVGEELDCKKELDEQEKVSLMKKIESVQDAIRICKLSSHDRVEGDIGDTMQFIEQKKGEMKAESEDYTAFLREVTEIVIEHKTLLQDGLKAHLDSILAGNKRMEANAYRPLFPDGAPP